jgi:hypothetical protein
MMQDLILIHFASHLLIVENKMPSLVHKENSRQRKSILCSGRCSEEHASSAPILSAKGFWGTLREI